MTGEGFFINEISATLIPSKNINEESGSNLLQLIPLSQWFRP